MTAEALLEIFNTTLPAREQQRFLRLVKQAEEPAKPKKMTQKDIMRQQIREYILNLPKRDPITGRVKKPT